MKPLSMAVLAAGLIVLSACGGSEEANLAADNAAADESLNALPEDLGDENLLGNEGDLNAVDVNAVDANAADANASSNAAY